MEIPKRPPTVGASTSFNECTRIAATTIIKTIIFPLAKTLRLAACGADLFETDELAGGARTGFAAAAELEVRTRLSAALELASVISAEGVCETAATTEPGSGLVV